MTPVLDKEVVNNEDDTDSNEVSGDSDDCDVNPEIMDADSSDDITDEKDISDENEVGKYSKKRTADQSVETKPSKVLKQDSETEHEIQIPTAEEFNTLKETEITINSSLFQLQIKELLTEVAVKQKWKQRMNIFVKSLCDQIKSISPKEGCDINKQKWIRKLGVKVPIIQEPKYVQGNFEFIPPEDIFTVGSFPILTSVKPDAHLDLAVVMPKACVHAMDYLNQRYFRKRAIYLACIAAKLKDWNKCSDLEFMYHHNNQMKPILKVKPSGKLGSHLCVHIHIVPEGGRFKNNRFHIKTNNVRKQWFFQNEDYKDSQTRHIDEEDIGGPTPYYNTTILRDLTMKDNSNYMEAYLIDATNVQQGISLLKVWLYQRELDRGHGSFSGFIMTMFVLYLLKKGKLNRHMSNYQILRSTLFHLGKANWAAAGISLYDGLSEEKHIPSLEEFQNAFAVVFIDISGYNNLCSCMLKSTFERVKLEAQLSLEHLETTGVDGFDILFMKPVLFLRKFDQIFHLSNLTNLKTFCETSVVFDQEKLLDYCGDYVHSCLSHLTDIMYQAIGKRIKLLNLRLVSPCKWPVDQAAPTYASNPGILSFGVMMNTDTWHSILDKGPAADDNVGSEEFREFWGDLAELRRFQDGSICEAVMWDGCKSVADRRKIITRALRHILHRHCKIPPEALIPVVDPLDNLLQTPIDSDAADFIQNGTGEELHLEIIRAFDELCKNLRSLSDLPLTVNTIQGTSPVFRYSETFPARRPVPGDVVKIERNKKYPFWTQPAPPYIPSMSVLCLLEGSGKWPDDLEAVQRIKAAFLLQLSSRLEQVHSLVTNATPTHVDVFKNGFVFRLQLGCKREIAIAKLCTTPDGLVKTIDTDRSVELERDLIALPKLTSLLHGLQQQFTSFCNTVRLVKRWMSAHMILDHYFMEEALELIVAYLYLHPEPFKTPNSSLPAFIRFLDFISKWDWRLHPLIVNLNGAFTKEDYDEIHSVFNKERSALPLMFIATPGDRNSQFWTQNKPNALILNRVVVLAKESLKVIENKVEQVNSKELSLHEIFRPPLDTFDVLIYLDPTQLSRRLQQIDLPSKNYGMKKDGNFKEASKDILPVVDYDPAQCYLKALRDTYNDFALFFYDTFGSAIVAVVWKPNVFEPKTFSASNVNAHLPKSTGQEVQLCPNTDAILEDFKFIGHGLVKKVEQRQKL